MSEILHFEDFSVGQQFALGPHEVSADAIKTFAREFDAQPFHLNEAAGDASVLQGLSASGFHTGGIMLRLICDAFLSRSSILGSSNMESMTWFRPVHAGDILSGMFDVTALRPSQSRQMMGIMNFRAKLFDQRAIAKAELVGTFFFRRRPA